MTAPLRPIIPGDWMGLEQVIRDLWGIVNADTSLSDMVADDAAVSDALSTEISDRVSDIKYVSDSLVTVSNALSTEISDRNSDIKFISDQVLAVSDALVTASSGLSDALSQEIFERKSDITAERSNTHSDIKYVSDAIVTASNAVSDLTIAAAIGGSDTQMQYNNGSIFGGASGLTYNDGTDVTTATGLIIDGTIATGLDMSGGTFATAVQNWPVAPVINISGVRFLKEDTANLNLFLGTEAFNNDDGLYNMGLGYRAGYNNDTTGGGSNGQTNAYIGYNSGYGATPATKNTGTRNLGLGNYTLYSNTTGSYCTGLGFFSLYLNTTGSYNFGLGYSALYSNTTGSYNVGIGAASLYSNLIGDYNIAIGQDALKVNTASYNMAVGGYCLQANTTGESNCGVGYASLFANIVGQRNAGVGNYSLYSANSSYNTSIGALSGYRLSSGNLNIFIGYLAGWYQTTNSNLIIIDNQDRTSAALEITNSLIYGVFAAAPADQSLRINGNLIIGAVTGIEMTTNDLTITTAANKTLVMSQSIYDDLQFQVSNAKVTPNNLLPSWEAFTANTSEYAFSVNEEVDTFANELPHWWKEGTAGHAHIHITTKGVPAQEQKAQFTVTFAYADTNEVWVEAPLTAELTIPISTTALTNLYLDLGDLTFTNYLIGAQIKCRIKRVAKTAGGTEYAGDIFITQVGIHLEKTRLGSRAELTS